MNPDELITCINKGCKNTINTSFNLMLYHDYPNSRHYVIDGTSYAVNNQELVKVLNWFDDFWLFLEITFNLNKKSVGKKIELQKHTLISLSVFQGKDSDDRKCQLFRAEWDDYNNPNEKHAQPHWHITSSQAIENTFDEYANVFEEQDFLQVLESEKQKVFDVKKIHFAMNGDWQNNRTHVHKMESEQQIVRWLQGVLTHLRIELEIL